MNLYLWLIPILPFAGFLVNGFLGRRLPKALVSTVALAFPLAAFGVVLRAAMLAWPGSSSIALPYVENFAGSWINAGALHIDFSFALDQLTLIMLLIIPESPRFLVSRGRLAKAEKVLARIFGAAEAQRKVNEIAQSLAADHHRPKLSDLLDSAGKVRRIVWVGIGLAVFQQLVGINIIFYYGTVLWESVGFSESDSLLINVVSGVLSIAACIFTIFTVDRIGRKPLLIVGSIGMAVTLSAIAASFATGSLVNGTLQLSHPAGLVALVSANLYVIFFNLSWGPVMWILLGEMFPNQIRGSGLAVAGFAQC